MAVCNSTGLPLSSPLARATPRLAGTLKPRASYTLKDVPAAAFIEAMSEHLKRKGTVTVPEWAEYAKTSCERACPPGGARAWTRVAAACAE